MTDYIVVYVDAFNRLKVAGARDVADVLKIVKQLINPQSDHYIPIERIHVSRVMGGAKEFLHAYGKAGDL